MTISCAAALDAPETIERHRNLIQKKQFLRKFYEDCYSIFRSHVRPLHDHPGEIIELGTGGGFLTEFIPGLVTSDVCPAPGIDRVFSADHMPFGEQSVKAICMMNVFHHLADPRAFLREADRVLIPAGRVIMIEPTYSLWAKVFYTYLHHEPFDARARRWEQPVMGRLSTSNQALPWIVFHRDRAHFEKEFPRLRILNLQPHTVTRYVLSGGLSIPALVPAFTYPFWRFLDEQLIRWPGVFPLFEAIVLEKT
jgi:SAM-dependent methyltransferase